MQETKLSKKKNTELTLGWWILTIFISLIISTVIILLIHVIWHPSIREITTNLSGSINIFKQGAKGPALPTIKKKLTILAMGVDSNGANTDPFEATRTDTMIVATLDPDNNTVNAISIPRDSKVYLADNKGIDKINAAHAYGGHELAVKTVEQTLGIKIDHYIIVNYNALKELVSAIGPIEVYVEKRMKYTDHAGKLYIDLQPGKQLLNADQAEMYLRFRHDSQGDIGRIKRQQWFLKGVIEKFKQPSIVMKIPQLIELAKRNVKTDMNIATMMKLAGFAKNIDLDKIQIATLPGSPSMYSKISYWLIDVNKSQILVDKLIHGYNDDEISEDNENNEPISLSILYNPEKSEDIADIISTLEDENYKIVCKRETKEVHTKLISHTNRAKSDTTSQLKNDLNSLKGVPVFLSPKEVLCAPSDYTIVLGKDQ